MLKPCYRVTEPVRRIAMTMRQEPADRRDPETIEDFAVWVRESVRSKRLHNLEQSWAERSLSLFDYSVEMFHKLDPKLYLHLEDEPRRRAVAILRREGWL